MSRPAHLYLHPDPHPGAHPTDSDEALWWWTPTLGPSATILAHHLTYYATTQPGTPISTDDLAILIGLGRLGSKLRDTLARLERFGVITFHSTDTITIRTQLPALSDRQLDRLPPRFAAVYRAQPAIG
jgi:predicted transcriptional regulator